MGYKDQMKRDIAKWREVADRVFFDAVKRAPDSIREAVMFDMTQDRLNDIATHQNERLIRNTVEGIIEMMTRRKELLEDFAKLAGGEENLSELDLLWVLKYGIELHEESVKKAFTEERERVYSRMVTAGFTNRVNSVLSGGLIQENEQKTQDQSEQ